MYGTNVIILNILFRRARLYNKNYTITVNIDNHCLRTAIPGWPDLRDLIRSAIMPVQKLSDQNIVEQMKEKRQ